MIDLRESILFLDRWTASNPSLKHSIASVDPDALAAEYRALWANAPCRLTSYFSGRDGTTQGRHPDTPRIQWEPRYAMALWNLECCWPRLDGGWHRFLDYQMPLKAHPGEPRHRQDRPARRHGPGQVACRRTEMSAPQPWPITDARLDGRVALRRYRRSQPRSPGERGPESLRLQDRRRNSADRSGVGAEILVARLARLRTQTPGGRRLEPRFRPARLGGRGANRRVCRMHGDTFEHRGSRRWIVQIETVFRLSADPLPCPSRPESTRI